MKRLYAFLFFVFFCPLLFAQNLSPLERQIIMASPDEMLGIVMDRSYEQGLLQIYAGIEEMDVDEVIPAYMAAYPGTTEDECLFIILKVALIASLGAGTGYSIETGFDILDFCAEIDSIQDISELPEELYELIESTYWKDCIGFYRIFDPEEFLQERFPEYY